MALDNIKEAKEFDFVRHNTSRHDEWPIKHKKLENCKYCGTGHMSGQCPVHGNKCGECGKPNHFKVVCRSVHRQQVVWRGRKISP